MWNFKIKTWHLFAIVFLSTALLFWQKGLFDFLFVEEMAGRDLAGNFGFARLMSTLISEGQITGWSNLWFAGFPAFEFYSPFFFLIVSFLGFIIPLEISFKLVVFLSVFLFPAVVFYSLRKMGLTDREAFLGALFSLGFLFLNGIFSAVSRAFNTGLVAQMFALNLLFLSMGFLSSLKNRTEVIIAGLLLGFVALSHPFIALFAALGWIVTIAIKPQKERILAAGLIALLMSSGWWLNALGNFEFMSPYVASFFQYSFPFLLIPLVVLGLTRGKKVIWIFAAFLISIMIYLFGPGQLQAFKFKLFFYSLPFAYVLSGIGASRVYELLNGEIIPFEFKKGKTAGIAALLLILASLSYGILDADIDPKWESGLEREELITTLEEIPNGRVLTQTPEREGDKYVLSSTVPLETGKPVMNELHVDSSLSSPYTLLLRDMVFENDVTNPVCKLCEKKIPNETISELLERYNVRYALTGEDNISHPDLFDLREKTGRFRIYERKAGEKRYEVLDHEPVGIKADVIDYRLLNDEVIQEGITDLYLVRVEEMGRSPFQENINLEEKSTEETVEEMKNIEPEETDEGASVKNFSYNNERITFEIDSGEKVPIFLKFSYHPKWECKGCEIFWTNPSLMSVYGKGEVELEYRG
ncbi:MAG: hypothetical protein ACLFTQ_00935 [Candidatus Aenigmatarchaeota archaeon]